MAEDTELRRKGIGRIGDIYVEQKAFEDLERSMYEIFDDLPPDMRKKISTWGLLSEIGIRLNDEKSVLTRAARHEIPVFSPGLIDSMIGLHIWTYSRLNILRLDPVLDIQRLSDIVLNANKTGAIILGGGLPKHFVLGANILREGVDAAVQVTLDRPEAGSFSGAPLKEAISWKKAKKRSELVTVIGDAVVLFPLMIAAALEKVH